jgi:hypothetical protein
MCRGYLRRKPWSLNAPMQMASFGPVAILIKHKVGSPYALVESQTLASFQPSDS